MNIIDDDDTLIAAIAQLRQSSDPGARLYARLAEDSLPGLSREIDIAIGAHCCEARARLLEQVTVLCANMLAAAVCSLSPPESRAELAEIMCRKVGAATGKHVGASLARTKEGAQ